MKPIVFIVLLLISLEISAQIVIGTPGGTPDSSAILDVRSTSQGFLIPRMDQNHIDAIKNPAKGLMIYNTTDSSFHFMNGNGTVHIGETGIGFDKETQFKKTVQVENMDDEAEAVSPTSDGGCIITGYTNVTNNGQTTLAIYLMKLTSGGLPDKNFGTDGKLVVDGSSFERAYAVRQTFNGGYIVVGYSASGMPAASFCFIKLTPSGQLDSHFGNNGIVSIKNGTYDFAQDVKQTADSGYIAVGYCFNGYDNDMYIVKLTKTGSLDYDFNWGGTLVLGSEYYNDYAYSVDITNDNKYFITGYTCNGSNGGEDVVIVKLNQEGGYDTGFGGGKIVVGSSNSEDGYSITALQDGGCFVTGTHSGGMFCLKLSSDATHINGKIFTNSNYYLHVNSIVNLSDTAFVLAGYALAHDNNSSLGFLMKVDSSLNRVSSFGTNGSLTISQRDFNPFIGICKTADNELVAVGSTQTSGSDKDIFIVKLNGSGRSCGTVSEIALSYTNFGSINTYSPVRGSGGTLGTFTPTITSQGTITTICE